MGVFAVHEWASQNLNKGRPDQSAASRSVSHPIRLFVIAAGWLATGFISFLAIGIAASHHGLAATLMLLSAGAVCPPLASRIIRRQGTAKGSLVVASLSAALFAGAIISGQGPADFMFNHAATQGLAIPALPSELPPNPKEQPSIPSAPATAEKSPPPPPVAVPDDVIQYDAQAAQHHAMFFQMQANTEACMDRLERGLLNQEGIRSRGTIIDMAIQICGRGMENFLTTTNGMSTQPDSNGPMTPADARGYSDRIATQTLDEILAANHGARLEPP